MSICQNTSETTKFNTFLTVFSDYCHTRREVHKAYMKGKGGWNTVIKIAQ